MKKSTTLIHQINPLKSSTKAVVEPLHVSTIFAMEQPSSHAGFQYGRVGNPTRLVLEETLAQYAGAACVVCTTSGSAALTALVMTLRAGDEVVCHDEVYEGSHRVLQKHFSSFLVKTHFLDCRNLSALEKHLATHPHTKMVLIETPTNPLLQILDIKKIAETAHHHSVLVGVDNTFATSLLQQPLALGADVVLESLSKHINGHSDVIGGMVATSSTQLAGTLRGIVETLGFPLSPRDAHEVLRGIKTMQLRVERQCATAVRVVSFLKQHAAVSRVLFPSGKLARSQMSKSGSLLAFNLSLEPMAFLKKLNLIKIAHSFGGVETVIQQPTQMMDLSFSSQHLKKFLIDDSFFRLSIGLEDPADIIEDVQQALE